jgi:hypothetical protein
MNGDQRPFGQRPKEPIAASRTLYPRTLDDLASELFDPFQVELTRA